MTSVVDYRGAAAYNNTKRSALGPSLGAFIRNITRVCCARYRIIVRACRRRFRFYGLMTYFTVFAVFSSCPGFFYLRCVVGIPRNVALVDDIVFVPIFRLLNTHVEHRVIR